MSGKFKVAFVCYGNSCRSQMSEGLGKMIGANQWEVHSAGSNPLGVVSPEAVVAMKDIGVDISDQYSKGIDEIPLKDIDLFVGMGCGPVCVVVPPEFKGEAIDWDVPDPYTLGQKAFDDVRDLLKGKIEKLFNDLNKKGKIQIH